MAKLTTNHLLFWFGTGASVPAGFTRYNIGTTARFLEGAAASTEGGATGGSLTHTHTCPDHTHTGVAHTHSVSANSITHSALGGSARIPPATGSAPVSPNLSHDTHSHAGANSASGTITYANKTGMVTDASSSGATTPPYVEALLIQPNATGAEVPANACCLFNSATPPTGFSKCDGAASTPNVDAKYIRIAANATTDGGATGGTTADHTHAVASHTHTVNAHVHAGCTSAVASATVVNLLGTTESNTGVSTVHTYDLDSTTSTINATAFNTAVQSVSDQTHIKQACIQNTSGADAIPVGIIVPYIGTLAALAALTDWDLCDGTGGTPDYRGFWVKSQFTSVGTSYGSAGIYLHNHGTTHGHTENSHTHTLTENACTNQRVGATAGAALRETAGFQHENEHTWTIANATATISDDSTGTNDADHRDPYLTVQWAQYNGAAAGRVVSLGGHIRRDGRVVLVG